MKKHLVAVLVQEPVSAFEFSCAAEIFGRPPEFGLPWYDFAVSAQTSGLVRTSGGLDLHVGHGLEAVLRADTVIVPGWDRARPSEDIFAAIKAAHARGARFLSVSSGVFLLARCGLLERRRVAAHWLHANDLAMRCPDTVIERDVLYVDEGEIVTCAGAAAALDMMLHVVRKDRGVRMANLIAARLVAPPHRGGDQPQRLSRPVPYSRDEGLGRAVTYLRNNVVCPLSAKKAAELARMTPRNLDRKFRQTFGCSVAEWVRLERLETAKEFIEESELSMEEIARTVGFGTTQSLRRAFERFVGKTPADYRREARAVLRQRKGAGIGLAAEDLIRPQESRSTAA